MSGLKFSGISKASCADVLRFKTKINSVKHYELGQNLVIIILKWVVSGGWWWKYSTGFGVWEAVKSGLKFMGISKASCAEVLRFNTEMNSVKHHEIGQNLVIII